MSTDNHAQPEPPPALRVGDCHLLAIPAELRLAIYAELLLFDDCRPERGLHPQILATCSFVNREAQSTLEDANLQTTLLAQICLSNGSSSQPTVRRQLGAPHSIPKAQRMQHEVSLFRPVPGEFQRAIIELTLSGVRSKLPTLSFHPEHMAKARFQVYLLATQILASINIKHVHFKVRTDGDENVAPEALRHALEYFTLPLRQLPASGMTLLVTGIAGQPNRDLIHKPLMQQRGIGAGPMGTTALSRWLEIKSETEALADLIGRANLQNTGIKFLFKSFFGNLGLPTGIRESQSSISDYYVSTETLHCQEAEQARAHLRTQKWKDCRNRAVTILAAAGGGDV